MTKKIVIIGVLVVAALAALPVVGNFSVNKVLDKRMASLEQNGIKVEEKDNGSNYLTTKRHYEFKLVDAVKFQTYLETLSEAQVPGYMSAMLDDVVMAADVEYSKVVVESDVSIDLYPVAFTKTADARMLQEDASLHEQMNKMLKNRAFMYHMDYDVAASKFKGYIKDIDETITFKVNKTAKILFKSATFKGDGTLVEPKSVDFNVKNADVHFHFPESAEMMLKLDDFSSSSDFTSKNSFDLDYTLSSLHFTFVTPKSNVKIEGEMLKALSTSKVTNKKLNTTAHISMLHFKVKDDNGSLELNNFDLSTEVNNVDEEAYLALQKASETAGPSSQFTTLAAIGVVSKGLELKIDNISAETMAIKDAPLMQGFKHKIDITIVPDDALIQKIQVSPLLVANNIGIDADLDFSTALYNYALQQNAQLIIADKYAKKEGDRVLFNIKVHQSQVLVNGQSLF